MVRQLETKISLGKTRGICYLYYKTQATGRAQKTRVIQPRNSSYLIHFPVFPIGPLLFCRQMSKMEDSASTSEKDMCFHLMTEDDQPKQSFFRPLGELITSSPLHDPPPKPAPGTVDLTTC